MRSLGLTRRLMGELRASEIRFCHWKSNDRLEEAMLGEGDLDLLIDIEDRPAFEALVARLGCIHLRSTGMKRFPGLEDFLGFDEATGELIHLHVHYQLVLGEKVKNHRLPLEHWLLERVRTLDGIPVPRLEDELLLLCVRSLLRTDLRACLRARIRRQTNPLPPSTQRELSWLAEQIGDVEVLDACRSAGLERLAPGLATFLERMRADRLSPQYVFAAKRALVGQLREYQRFPTVVCGARRAWYGVRHSRAAKRVRPTPRKRLDASGVYAALVGADGSGKTTLARDLPTWLNWKLESSAMYYGQPKSSVALIGLRRVRRITGDAARRDLRGHSAGRGRLLEAISRSANAALWLMIALRRARLDVAALKRVKGGMVVFAERFPLRELWSMEAPMDGPRLQSASTDGRLVALAARLEQRLYRRIHHPDQVLVLAADLEVLQTRKPETPLEEHRAKIRAIQRLVEEGNYDVIDASRPYADVLLIAKRCVWHQLLNASRERPPPSDGDVEQAPKLNT